MKRRLVWTATLILASPRWAGAAAAGARLFRLGMLSFAESAGPDSDEAGIVAELARQGFKLGGNLGIERRFSRTAGHDAAAAALAALKVDAIYAGGTELALAAKRATSSIPIVFTSADPVGFGLVASLARPGGNLTGVSIQGPAITTKEMEAAHQAIGTLRTFAHIHLPGARSQPWYASYVGAATSAAKALGVQVEFHEAADVAAYEPLIRELVRRKVDAAELMPGTAAVSLSRAEYEQIAALGLRHRLPMLGPARLGFLLNCEFANEQMVQRVGYFLGRIFGGTRPAELPVEEFSTLRLVVNAKTAKALGLTLRPSLLLSAAEVIR